MKIELYGGPRDGQVFDLGEAAPWPNEIEVQLCLVSDYVANDIEQEVAYDLIGKTAVYRNAGCGKHYVLDGMRGHQKP